MTNKISQYQFIETLKKLSFIDEILLYGSRARGDNEPKSDIDLAIKCPKASIKDWSDTLLIIENAS